MKRILFFILSSLSQAILKKYQPDIIGITGSVGKTSTKEAVYVVLKESFRVRKNIKNYNNEIGVPLTIIGSETGGKSFFKWVGVFFKSAKLLLIKDDTYPEILIIEMGADHPGDIAYLTSFVKCKLGILTSIGAAHLEYFGSLEKIAEEKRNIISHLSPDDWAIINIDNDLAWQQKAHSKAKIMSYGMRDKADVRAQDVNLLIRHGMIGLNFKLIYQGTIVPIFLPNIISQSHISAILAATAVGLIYNMNLVQIGDRVREYKSAPGRAVLMPGIKNTQLIDDTYNSSPLAAKAALDLLVELPLAEGSRRFAVLGDMLELGAESESEHISLGKKVAKLGIDYLITFGERARDIARGAKQSGMPEDYIFSFNNHDQAGRFIQDRIRQGDAILIKGSQGVRMEKITKEIMAEPEKAGELLVRQYDKWLKS